MERAVICSSFVALLLYINTLTADFAYDDSRAILKNPDLSADTPLSQLWFDDFWGTPLTHTGSHKSYRPLCVLTFRLNNIISGLQPFGFHLINVVLHVMVTGLFTFTAGLLLPKTRSNMAALTAGLLFASHPIHTEAVAGIVGRADILSAFFFLCAFLSHMSYCRYRELCRLPRTEDAAPQNGTRRVYLTRKWVCLLVTAVCACASMLSKEQGVTVLAVCVLYDVFVHSRMPLRDVPTLLQVRYRGLVEGVLVTAATFLALVGFRVYFMGSAPPEFAPADNPAADSDSLLTRSLTFLLLPCLNIKLLLYPRTLSFDWSMGAVPLVESVWDPRNVCTLVVYVALTYVVVHVLRTINVVPRTVKSANGHAVHANSTSSTSSHRITSSSPLGVKRRHGGRRSSSCSTDSNDDRPVTPPPSPPSSAHTLLLSLAFLIIPFIPATNLFFYVGFVIAERVLYIPSMGFCLLLAHGVALVDARYFRHRRRAIPAVVLLVVLCYGARTVVRNNDWQDEEHLYRAGIDVNPAKAWGNLANILNTRGEKAAAEEAYRAALSERGNMADVHYNLGILYQDQGRHLEAVDSYQRAIQCRPRLTMAHLNLGIVYAVLDRKEEAEQIYRHCAQIDTSGLKDPRLHEDTRTSALYNLGRLLADQDRHQEAIVVYEEAISRRASHYAPQSLYNMLGESHFKLGHLTEAETWYQKALQAKPDHPPAHLTMAKLHQKKGLLVEAETWFKKAIALEPESSSPYQHYGQFLSDVGRHLEAAQSYLQAVNLSPDKHDFELAFNTANAIRQAGKNHDAETYYRIAVQRKPNLASGHMNLGAMLHFNGKLDEAEASYLSALELQPDDQVTRTNLHKLRNLQVKARAKSSQKLSTGKS